MSYRTEAAAVLAEWRAVERLMLAARPGTPESERLSAEWARLRQEFGRLTDLAAHDEQSKPTTLPTAAATGDPKRELAVRSDEMLDELTHLKATERQKRREPISTDAFHELADEVTASSRRVFALGAEQEALGDEAETGDETIEDVERAG